MLISVTPQCEDVERPRLGALPAIQGGFEGTRATGSNVVRPGQLAAFQTRESKGGDENEELEQDETLIALGDPDSVGLVSQA